MISTVKTMLTCQWSARHLQRYLDADPAAQLTSEEVSRLESHLAICEKCAELSADYQGLQRRLVLWSPKGAPDPAMVARVRLAAQRVMTRDDA